MRDTENDEKKKENNSKKGKKTDELNQNNDLSIFLTPDAGLMPPRPNQVPPSTDNYNKRDHKHAKVNQTPDHMQENVKERK